MGLGRVSYGWIVVAVLCVTETVTWGIVYYGYPVFGLLTAALVVVSVGVFAAGTDVARATSAASDTPPPPLR